MRKYMLLLIFLLLSLNSILGQNTFALDQGVKRDKIKFELLNNLIIVPIELNGLKLSFLLDTGVKTTVLLGLNEMDSLDLPNAGKIKLRGLGSDKFLEAYISENNRMKVGKASSDDLTVFLILDSSINFSPRLGFPVHGILGYDFFKNFVVEINYQREFLRIYPLEKEPPKVKRYDAVPLVFHKGKPYINILLSVGDNPIKTTLLLDSGLTDALWLFEDGQQIFVPESHYNDFLGLGLVGDIFGKRSRSSQLEILDLELTNILTSFPDTTAFGNLKLFTERNGSIGGEILRRFYLIFNYSDKKLYLKKNSDFGDDYFLDMSGITVEHDGFMITMSSARIPSFSPRNTEGKGTEVFSEAARISRTISLRPEFRIARLRIDSPAEKAGLQVGDKLITINSRKVYKMEIEEITRLMASKEGKRIKMKVDRNGKELTYIFNLERPL